RVAPTYWTPSASPTLVSASVGVPSAVDCSRRRPMTTGAQRAASPTPQVDEPAAVKEPVKVKPPPRKKKKSPLPDQAQKPRIIIGIGVLVAVVIAYALSLLGVHMLQR